MGTLLNISLPFFGLIAAGYAAGRTRVLPPEAAGGLNAFVFWFALPAFLFMRMSAADTGGFDLRFVIAYSGGELLCFVICYALARALFGRDPERNALRGAAGAFGNIGYMGLPIIVAVFGERMLVPAVTVILMDNFLMFLPSILIQLARRAGGAGAGPVLRMVIGTLLRNPLLLAMAAGLACGAFEVAIPVPLASFGNLLSAAAAPCALFVLGATLVGRPLTSGFTEVAMMSIGKLVLHPALVFGIAVLVSLDPELTAVAVVEASLPIAAHVFITARTYEVYAERISSAILFSTVCAVVSVSLVLYWFAPA
jgi:malonate transporter